MKPSLNLRVEAAPLARLRTGNNLFQSGYWGRFKARFGWQPLGFRYSCALGSGALLVLCREIAPERQVAYVPLGPELEVPPDGQGPLLEALAQGLQPRLPRDSVFVRFDLPWESPYAAEPTSEAVPPADPRPGPRLRELRMNFGTQGWRLHKAPTDLLPPDTVLVDIEAEDEVLLSRMSSTARYNVRMSGRRGVTAEVVSPAELGTWYRMYTATTGRHRIPCHPLSYFRTLWEVTGERGESHVRLLLLLARAGERPAAGMILALVGRRAVFLFGASVPGQGRLAPSHRLQWRAMQVARARGCADYDLFGIPPSGNPGHPMHGLFMFKTGFGGSIVRRRGCWDYWFDEPGYTRLRGMELGRDSFHRPGGA